MPLRVCPASSHASPDIFAPTSFAIARRAFNAMLIARPLTGRPQQWTYVNERTDQQTQEPTTNTTDRNSPSGGIKSTQYICML